jgi:hypothetical protein
MFVGLGSEVFLHSAPQLELLKADCFTPLPVTVPAGMAVPALVAPGPEAVAPEGTQMNRGTQVSGDPEMRWP